MYLFLIVSTPQFMQVRDTKYKGKGEKILIKNNGRKQQYL